MLSALTNSCIKFRSNVKCSFIDFVVRHPQDCARLYHDAAAQLEMQGIRDVHFDACAPKLKSKKAIGHGFVLKAFYGGERVDYARMDAADGVCSSCTPDLPLSKLLKVLYVVV
jgi:hypothetical protein